jgi:hypothetical protein
MVKNMRLYLAASKTCAHDSIPPYRPVGISENAKTSLSEERCLQTFRTKEETFCLFLAEDDRDACIKAHSFGLFPERVQEVVETSDDIALAVGDPDDRCENFDDSAIDAWFS